MPRTLVAITGASSGIGATFACRLAPDHDLLLIARRQDRLEELASELSSRYGCQAEILVADLTSERDLESVANRLATDDRLVLLVNNAGFGTKGLFWESDLAPQWQMHQLHVMATVRLTHAALRNLVPRDLGAVINVASVSAFVRIAGTASYAATKSWMTTFSEALALELRSIHSRVLVQALCPGFTYSEFHQAMGINQDDLRNEGFWMSSDYVVEASLRGLHKGKIYVVPNWRYRLITAFLSKLPSALRITLEERIGSARRRRELLGSADRPLPPASDA